MIYCRYPGMLRIRHLIVFPHNWWLVTVSTMRFRLLRVRAAYRFKGVGAQPNGTERALPSPISTGDYSVSPEQLTVMTRDHELSTLQNYREVEGLSETLKTNADKGIHDDESNILERKFFFGSNTYPRKKGRSFWGFVLDAGRDTTLIILMVAAAASLALGCIKDYVATRWYRAPELC